jgi:hypothetical protein
LIVNDGQRTCRHSQYALVRVGIDDDGALYALHIVALRIKREKQSANRFSGVLRQRRNHFAYLIGVGSRHDAFLDTLADNLGE